MNAVKTLVGQYVTMFAGCVRYMASDANKWRNIETGGGLYGLWSHVLRPVIMLATPAGPGACRERAHFAFDPDYATWVNRYLQEQYGIQYLGPWHSHHNLGLDHPSPGDADQVHGVASRHGIDRMVQIVVTYEEGEPSGDQRVEFKCACQAGDLHAAAPATQRPPRHARFGRGFDADHPVMRINTFVYFDASQGPWARAALKIIPGPNPIRTALAGSDILSVPGTSPPEDFPLERIVWDEVSPSERPATPGQAVPSILVQQLEELPEEIACQTEIYPDDGLVMLSLPFWVDCRLCVVYLTKVGPPRIHSVRLMRTSTKESEEVTQLVLRNDPSLSLSALFNRARQVFGQRE